MNLGQGDDMNSNEALYQVIQGDCLTALKSLPPGSVQCVVTSPPYWALRDYGKPGQIGMEETPDEYVNKLVAVFQEVKRVLKDDGVLWLNLGDSYAGSSMGGGPQENRVGGGTKQLNRIKDSCAALKANIPDGLKQKDLVGIPWRVALALQVSGWYLRSDVIWNKPNAMPESVTDRPTKAHEYVFLLSKSEKYYYNAAAIAEPAVHVGDVRHLRKDSAATEARPDNGSRRKNGNPQAETKNRRSVWTINTVAYKEAHFATFPPELAEICILAGSRPGDTVLDPFAGSGTTLAVALQYRRRAIGIELNPDYIELIHKRIAATKPILFTAVLPMRNGKVKEVAHQAVLL